MVMQIRKTDVYAEWIDNLRDLQGRARILCAWSVWRLVTRAMSKP
jgi:putative component of toxin-antitoxin plasmid stabilization module